jgi:hypothetical protein
MFSWIMRLFGGLNILVALFGLYYSFYMLQMHWHHWPGNPSHLDWAVFLTLSLLSTFIILYLGYLGVRLIKRDVGALRKVCLVFIFEILYFWADVIVNWNLVSPSRITIQVGFWGIALAPLDPQIVTGYPLIGIVATIVLVFFHRRAQNAAEVTLR